MDLKTITNEARPAQAERVLHNGTQTGIIVKSGKLLKIKTTGPEGIDILNAEVPDGKVWKVAITVGIKETDV